MKHYFLLIFCAYFIATSSCLANEDKILKLFNHYYQTQILPFHDAARNAVDEFNKQQPDEELKEVRSEKISKIIFKSLNPEKNWTLKVNPQTNIGMCYVKLQKTNNQRFEHLVERDQELAYQTILAALMTQQ